MSFSKSLTSSSIEKLFNTFLCCHSKKLLQRPCLSHSLFASKEAFLGFLLFRFGKNASKTFRLVNVSVSVKESFASIFCCDSKTLFNGLFFSHLRIGLFNPIMFCLKKKFFKPFLLPLEKSSAKFSSRPFTISVQVKLFEALFCSKLKKLLKELSSLIILWLKKALQAFFFSHWKKDLFRHSPFYI